MRGGEALGLLHRPSLQRSTRDTSQALTGKTQIEMTMRGHHRCSGTRGAAERARPAIAAIRRSRSARRQAPTRSNNRATSCGDRSGRARAWSPLHKATERPIGSPVNRSLTRPSGAAHQAGHGSARSKPPADQHEEAEIGIPAAGGNDRQRGSSEASDDGRGGHDSAQARGPWPILRLGASAARTIRARPPGCVRPRPRPARRAARR